MNNFFLANDLWSQFMSFADYIIRSLFCRGIYHSESQPIEQNPTIIQQPKKEKNYKIQIIRAIAIICVVLIHTCKDGLNQVFIRPFVNSCVGTFIFLSGYLTSFEIKDIKTFYQKRIFRVLFPYVLWISLTGIAKGRISMIPIYLITSKASSHFYYILVYIQFVLLTPVIIKLIKSKYRLLGWYITPLFTIIFKYIPMICGYELNRFIAVVWGDSCLSWFTFYYLGLCLGNKIVRPTFVNKDLFIVYAISIVIQMGEGYVFYLLQKNGAGTQIKLSSFLTTSIYTLLAYNYINNGKEIKRGKWYNKIGIVLGDCSFGIYLSHLLIILIIKHLFPFYNDIPFCINSALVLSVSCVCVIIFRRIFGNKLSKIIGFL